MKRMMTGGTPYGNPPKNRHDHDPALSGIILLDVGGTPGSTYCPLEHHVQMVEFPHPCQRLQENTPCFVGKAIKDGRSKPAMIPHQLLDVRANMKLKRMWIHRIHNSNT